MSVFFDSPTRYVRLSLSQWVYVADYIARDLVPEGEAEQLLSNIGIGRGIAPAESSEYRQLLAAVHDVAESYPREQLRRPDADEQDYGNAWAHKFLIRGNAKGGILSGKTLCLKDNIAVAGVPQFFGTDAIPAWVPEADATVVKRAYEAGADIVGTTICENFCNSTSSFTSAQGMVHNPHAKGYSAGGSTSGGTAVVGGGLVDIAIGADQGGSIRVPSSFCGCELHQILER
jgi:amidase